MPNLSRVSLLFVLSLLCAHAALAAGPCTRTARLVCAPGCRASLQNIRFTHHDNDVGSLLTITCDATVEGGAVATADIQLSDCDVDDFHCNANVVCTDAAFTPVSCDIGYIPAVQVPWGVEFLVISPGVGRCRAIGAPSPGDVPSPGKFPADDLAATLFLDQPTTGVGDPTTGRVLLLQNIPNPFGRSTSIHYVLPRAAQVRLGVFSLTGRLVRELVSNTQAAGPYDVVWDGTDREGRRVAAGKYVYRLVVDGWPQTESMTALE